MLNDLIKMSEETESNIIRGLSPVQPLLNISLGKLIYNKLINNPNEHKALVDAITGETRSFKDILEKSSSLANFLSKNGYGRNSIFGICSENNLDFHIAVISALFIGAIIAPINHTYTSYELEHIMNISKPKLIFCSENTCPKILELKKKIHFVEKIIVLGNKDNNQSLDKIISGFLIDKFQPIEVDPNDQVAFIMTSSGTTGLPKGVMLTHLNITTVYLTFIHPDIQLIKDNNNSLAVLPFFHAYGLLTTLYSILHNEKTIVMKQFEENVFLSSIEKYKITKLTLAPPLMVHLAKSPLVSKYDLSSLVEILCGAAPLDKQTQQFVKQRLQIKSIRQGYGLTESTLGVAISKQGEEKFGSSGHIVPYMSCKVRDPETELTLGPKQVGELCFKGPMLSKGYYNNEEATKGIFTKDGWLLTGDLGYYDENEYIFIVDRLKELIKYKGYQVAPAELEAILLSHPEIIDVGVVGLPDEIAGELPVAFVVKAQNSKINETDVKKFVAKRVSSQKQLKGGVHFVKQIPKNPSGKILRRELRNILKKNRSKL